MSLDQSRSVGLVLSRAEAADAVVEVTHATDERQHEPLKHSAERADEHPLIATADQA